MKVCSIYKIIVFVVKTTLGKGKKYYSKLYGENQERNDKA